MVANVCTVKNRPLFCHGDNDCIIVLFTTCACTSDTADSLNLDSWLALRTRVHDVPIPCVLNVLDRQTGTQHLEYRVVIQLGKLFAALHGDVVQSASDDLDICVCKVVGQVIGHLIELIVTMLTNTAEANVLTNDVRTIHSEPLF